MTREPTISGDRKQRPRRPQPADWQSEVDNRLRPQRIAEIVGQRDVVQRVEIAIEAARQRGETLGHILFDGPPGLGKTTFATCIPRELGVPVEFLSGPGLGKPKDLVPSLTNLQKGQVLFIDEIHRISNAVEEYLYTAMEDFRIDLVLGEGINARTHSVTLQPFTLIGATTRAGMLTSPLRDRFIHRERLGFYQIDELTEIVRRNAAKLEVTIDDDAATEIARRSRGTPRVANNRLRWIRDYAQTRADGHINMEVTADALTMAEIDSLGLDGQDRNYLTTLIRVCAGGPTGIDTIAATMNAAVDTLADEVEPFLLRSELILRTPRGRVATARAYQHLDLPMPPQMTLFD
ncbi:MAG: Holliday junction branch migration DNA helicase RuvB [Pirellulaceae bacterium]